MNYKEFNDFCAALTMTTYVMQWNHSHVWKVGGKVFAIGGLGKDEAPTFTFKTSELNFHFLSELSGYKPAPYFASRGMKWIQHYQSNPETDNDLSYYIKQSYRLVWLGLSKQKQFGLNQNSKILHRSR